MASTYSTNLKLELIGTGDQSGTWGVTTNTNLGSLIEEAIAGYVTQAVTDGSPTVLTIPNGASSNGRNYVIELTGALTAARTVEVPAVDKPYIFFNATTGGFAVTVKVSGQTGVSIANGKKAIVYANSTDVIEVANAPVTEAGTQTLTNKTLTSPILTAPALGTPASGVLTNVTGLPLTTGVTGTLPIANGGTGTTSTTFASLTTNVTGTLPIANGGTGSTATPTAGGVIYGTGTVQAVSVAGTSGQVLKSNGASAPTWITPSSGALVLLSTVTASASATVDIETTFDSTYDADVLVATGVRVSVDTATLLARMKIGGTYDAAANYRYSLEITSAATYDGLAGAGAGSIQLSDGINSAAVNSANFSIQTYTPTSTALYKMIEWSGASLRNDGNVIKAMIGRGYNFGSAAALTGIRILPSSGNITAGTFRLYGIANS